MKKKSKLGIGILRALAFPVGIILILAGGVTFLWTTIPGVGLIVWSLTGNFWKP
jgi:hypothetical protein